MSLPFFFYLFFFMLSLIFFFFSSRRRHTRSKRDWSSDVCSSDLLEMGMNHFNEIDLLSKIASPNYAIITNIGESHLEFLGSRQGIAEAKLEITNGLKSDGKLIIDGDEKLLEHIKESNNIIKCGFDNSNDFIIENVLVKPNQTRFHLSDGMDYSIPLLGKHHAKNASYAIALGKQLGMNGEQLKNALNNL